MIALAVIAGFTQYASLIQRDSYGVPHIKAASWGQAFRAAGYAVAQDRLWQMETSRLLARGSLAAALGPAYAASDREVLQTSYTDAELDAQVSAMSPKAREAWEQYAAGINDYVAEAKSANSLPEQFAKAGFEPSRWTTTDSAAIAVRMGQMFGRGGAGEIRNMAMLAYLRTQKVKDRALDVIDDFAWQNDPRAIPTVSPEDDRLAKTHPAFPLVSRKATQDHIAMLPEASIFELLPGLRLVSLERSREAAQFRGAPFKTGSYAIVVGPSRSILGRPLLLSAPQMGFTNPSIVHEMTIEAPGLKVGGMDVPGIPGVLIGQTDRIAWGLTSGVADTDDIFFTAMDGERSYKWGDKTSQLTSISRLMRVKGAPDQTVTQLRTHLGPVVVTSASGKAYFSRRSSYFGQELKAFDAMAELYSAARPADIRKLASQIPLTFNLFYATAEGDIGYQYCGKVPLRAPGADPRFPTPGKPEFDWRGFVPPDQMPYVVNPKSGLIANWNNKPVAWWPNFDTPVWGRIFRNESLLANLRAPRLGVRDLEMAAWSIARMDETAWQLLPLIREAGLTGEAAKYLAAFDGYAVDGSQGATIYKALVAALREQIFADDTGNFLQPELFRLAVQPSLIADALERRTRLDYLNGASARDTIRSAFEKATARLAAQLGPDPALWRFSPAAIQVPGQPPIPYSDRGSYIQIIEFGAAPVGRNVLPPGVAATGENSTDQAFLARSWTYKPMRWWQAPPP